MHLSELRREIGQATLVAVSKYQSVEAIKILYEQGQRAFGESRATELAEKHAALPTDIEWHFIGHLQTNKVRQVLPLLTCIQSVDSEKLLQLIAQEAAQINRKIDVLLQVKIAQEDSKYGFDAQSITELAKKIQKATQNGEKTFEYVRFIGIMGMASNTSDEKQVKNEFLHLKSIFDTLKTNFFTENEDFSELSMGMSGDYRTAIAAGSTMVRVGSLLF